MKHKMIVFLGLVLFSGPYLAVSEEGSLPTVYTVRPEEGSLPTLFSAIQKEDSKLYSKEMKLLLEQPITEFIKVIKFETKEGNNISQLMARVHSNQEFFEKERQNLIDVFNPKSNKNNLSLGGVNIALAPLEDTHLGQAIKSKDASAILKIVTPSKSISAIEWIQNIHSKTKADEFIKDLTTDLLSIKKLLDSPYQNEEFLTEISYNEGNSSRKDNVVILSAVIGFLTGSFFINPYYPITGLEATTAGTIGAAVTAYTTSKCYGIFAKIKKRKLTKK